MEEDLGSYQHGSGYFYGDGKPTVDERTMSTASFSPSLYAPSSLSHGRTANSGKSRPSKSSRAGSRKRKEKEQYMSGPPALSWRLDPDESLSDWTLTVVSCDNFDKKTTQRPRSDSASSASSTESIDDAATKSSFAFSVASSFPTKKYFVHRTQLAVGPRRSEYFAKLFKNRRSTPLIVGEGGANSPGLSGTRIELKPSAAAAFPAMLDFIYSSVGTPPDVTTVSAVALRHLATCFGIRELFDLVTDFIKQDLSTRSAPAYLLEAATYRHDKLQAAAVKICAENFESTKLSRIVTLPPELFKQVVRSPHLQCESEVLSTRVASYCRCRPGAVDLETLKSLTDADVMPRIAAEESVFYLHLLVMHGLDSPDRGDGADGTLYERCAASCHNVVKEALEFGKSPQAPSSSSSECRHKQNTFNDYNRLPLVIRVDLLETALCQGPQTQNLPSPTSVPIDTSPYEEATQEAEAQLKRARKTYDKRLATLESQLEAREREVRQYAEELSKFVRVPNEYRVTPLLSEYTYQETPEYNEYGESIYGYVPPTALPSVGVQSNDGWIFREERWNSSGRGEARYWPMFYYQGD